MKDLFAVLCLLSIVGFVAGVIKPSLVKIKSRKQVSFIFGTGIILFFIIFSVVSLKTEPVIQNSFNQPPISVITSTSSSDSTIAPNPIQPSASSSLQVVRSNPVVNQNQVPEAIAPILLSGDGQQATQQFILQQGLSVFVMQNTSQRNFIVRLLDSNGKMVKGLVNEIGNFSGSKAVRIPSTGIYLLNVQSDGPWTITITQPRLTDAPVITGLSGKGSQATTFFNLFSGLNTFALTHDGSENFIVHLFDKNGNTVDGLVNEIGAYSGSKAEHISKSGPYLLNIQADGNWTVRIK